MSFKGEKGDHFFRSTLVQTLFYGLFAAWVFWAEHHEPTDAQARFRWREAAGYLHIPILQKLFYDFANPAQLGALQARRGARLGRRGAQPRRPRLASSRTFEQSHAVQYFYEPFLEAFDPELRKELGVWYTPPEIVKYMVARVDQVLREELDIADGLADPRVVVLDPCCGTGAYLVEVLDRIAATLAREGRRRAHRPRPQEGRHEPRLRLRDPAGAVRHQPPADRHAAAPPRRAASPTSPTSAPAST